MKPTVSSSLAGLFALCMGMLTPAISQAQDGESLYQTCAACHGAEGQGNAALKAPPLSHLTAAYIAGQLQKFRNGQRGGEGDSEPARQMATMAATLPGDDAIGTVAQFAAALEGIPEGEAEISGDVTLGGDYYNQFCGACHGPGAEGNKALSAPSLAGAPDWYLYGQLKAFREGTRGAHPDDRTGRQMRAMAGVLPSDQALRDVTAFIAGLR